MTSLSKVSPARTRAPFLSVTTLLLLALLAGGGEPELKGPVKIDWGKKEFTDLSAIGLVGKYLIVANDESNHSVHVLEAKNGGFKYLDNIRLSERDEELDLEGIACDKNIVYVIGSHSRNQDNDRQPAREKVFKFELGKDGRIAGRVAETSLRDAIVKNPVLGPASRRKPKEGGVDIEGIAVHNEWLYAGFRGPLHQSDALVLKFRFEKPAATAQLLTVDLGGLGIRDLTRVENGFLILAGPLDDAAGPYQLHHWDGQGGPASKIRRLSTIPTKDGAKAEGLAVVHEDSASYEFVVLFDGPRGGDPRRYRLKK